MITNLNQKVQAEEPKEFEYKVLPEGTYRVRIKEIKPWEATTKDIKVYLKDEKGFIKKDDKGNKLSELHKDFTFYNARVIYEVIEGEHSGRQVSENLTTHPNVDFVTKNFLYAANIDNITIGEIPNKCVGIVMDIDVTVDTYDKVSKVRDENTGIETTKTEKKETNRVKGFKRIELEEDGL